VVNANAAAAISLYTVGADGVLTPMTPATLAASTYLANVAIDFSGKYLYATSGYPGSSVFQYTIGANGTPCTRKVVPWLLGHEGTRGPTAHGELHEDACGCGSHSSSRPGGPGVQQFRSQEECR